MLSHSINNCCTASAEILGDLMKGDRPTTPTTEIHNRSLKTFLLKFSNKVNV
jgi:hypothetical protein